MYFGNILQYKHIFIYLLRNYLNPDTAGSVRINAKEREKEKTSEKSEEKERDRGTEGEILYSIPGNWCAHGGRRTERKTKGKKQGVDNTVGLI